MVWMSLDTESGSWERMHRDPDIAWMNRRETTKWMLTYYRQVPEEIVLRYEAAQAVVETIAEEIERLPEP